MLGHRLPPWQALSGATAIASSNRFHALEGDGPRIWLISRFGGSGSQRPPTSPNADEEIRIAPANNALAKDTGPLRRGKRQTVVRQVPIPPERSIMLRERRWARSTRVSGKDERVPFARNCLRNRSLCRASDGRQQGPAGVNRRLSSPKLASGGRWTLELHRRDDFHVRLVERVPRKTNSYARRKSGTFLVLHTRQAYFWSPCPVPYHGGSHGPPPACSLTSGYRGFGELCRSRPM